MVSGGAGGWALMGGGGGALYVTSYSLHWERLLLSLHITATVLYIMNPCMIPRESRHLFDAQKNGLV